MRYVLLFLFLFGCSGGPEVNHNSNTEVVVHYEGKEVYRRGSKYIGPNELQLALNSGREVIVVFAADWCKNCNLLRTAEQQAKLKVPVYYINVDEPWANAFAAELGIKSIPLMAHIGKDQLTVAIRQGAGQIITYLVSRF